MDNTLINLGAIQATLNGEVVAQLGQLRTGKQLIPLPQISPNCTLTVAIDRQANDYQVQYSLHNLPSDFTVSSFGIQCSPLVNVRTFLRTGYFSWDGSYYIGAEELPLNSRIQGYAMTQLLPLFGEGSLVIGYIRHDRFQHSIALERTSTGLTLTCETLVDEKWSTSHQYDSEPLLLMPRTGSNEEALRDWARAVAQTMNARVDAPPQLGWCSWYNLYGYITEANILEHLRSTQSIAAQEQLAMNVFQIDDGFTPEMGDWLMVKPQFPRGMKPLLADIRSAGFTPGLWIAPFMVGNRSRLFAEHPDWVVQDRQTGRPLAHMTFYAEFRWHKRSEEYYILDVTHPKALAYISHVFHVWHHEWGCEYFKTDFMHFGSEYGPERAQWYTPGKTRIEIWRTMAETIRHNIGSAFWLGCGCPLWASVGLVDGIRIGRDVGVTWDGESLAAQSLLRDQATRNFANGILWQADPDCILLRERFHQLTDTEVQSLAIYAGMSSGLVLTSDDLAALSPDRLRLWKLLLSPNKSQCDFPLLGQSALALDTKGGNKSNMRALDPVLVQVRRTPADNTLAVFFLNTGETAIHRAYPLPQVGLHGAYYYANWMESNPGDACSSQPVNTLNVRLARHEGILYFLSPEPFAEIPQVLP